MKILFRKSGVGFALLCVLFVLSLVAGCAGNKSAETQPTPVFSPPDKSKPASSTNSPSAQPLSTREQRAFGEGRQAKARTLHESKPKPGTYDASFIASVQQHWYDLLDRSGYDYTTKGKVTLEFRLLADGSISDMKAVKTTVNTEMTALCKKAILEAAPFAPWPPSMRSKFSKGYREIQFSFYFD